MILADIKTALLTVTSKVYHFDATGATGNYIVWAEDGQADSVWADGRMKEQIITGTIDYFTKIEYDPNFNAIQEALNEIGISYQLNSIQYESDTKYIHTEWVFDISVVA
ncbi:MAG TPA: hypothetical protein VFC41_09780 [Anaerovoracaceae bacterium]|nr:hypothetical protein [Anaerovoracaceae bacterium]